VRTILISGLKLLGLSVYLFVCYAVASGMARPVESPPEGDPATAALALVTVCVLNTAVLAYIITRSRWTGWRLVVAIFIAFFGTTTLMSQIESVVFISRLPEGFILRVLLMGAIVAAAFAPVAVLALGKWKPTPDSDEPKGPVATSPSGWAWRLAAIAAVYVVLYFTFGYYVAWRSPAVRAYYGGTDPGTFVQQMGNVLRDTPWLPPFQVFRAMLWALIALPVVQMTKGRWWVAGLGLSLLFSVVMNSQLLIPNPIMPEAVRLAHFVETASSNFIFGWIVAWLLRPNDESWSPHARP